MIGRVLVVKLGALGDVVLAMGPFAAIRDAHAGAHITLLTTAPYAEFLGHAPYFDDIWLDDRPAWWNPGAWLDLRRRLRGAAFDFVYDLQTSDRSGWYYRMMGPGPRPAWSGIARGCSHPHDNPARDDMHTIERQSEQLAHAGINAVGAPDLSWVEADVSALGPARPFVLLVPGGSAHRPAKRWPVERYAELANGLAERGTGSVVIGGPDEGGLGDAIIRLCPTAVNLAGRTTFADIVALARAASGVVGNDTGPLHLIAATGCPGLVLYSAESDPALTRAPAGTISVLQRDDLAMLATADVAQALTLR